MRGSSIFHRSVACGEVLQTGAGETGKTQGVRSRMSAEVLWGVQGGVDYADRADKTSTRLQRPLVAQGHDGLYPEIQQFRKEACPGEWDGRSIVE